MYWYSDDRSIQFNFKRQKSGQNKAFYGLKSSPVFLTNMLKYRLDRQLPSYKRGRIELKCNALVKFIYRDCQHFSGIFKVSSIARWKGR